MKNESSFLQLQSREPRKEGSSLCHWILLWCQIVVTAVLKSVGDVWRNIQPNISTSFDCWCKRASRKWKKALQRVGWRVTSPIFNLNLYLLEFSLCWERRQWAALMFSVSLGGAVKSGILPRTSDITGTRKYYRPFQFGFLVSTSGTPWKNITLDQGWRGSMSTRWRLKAEGEVRPGLHAS